MDRDWRYWLKATANYYDISQAEVLSSLRTNNNARARSTFYWLLFKNNIDLYRVAQCIGKSKSTIAKYINNSVNKENNRDRDKSAEDYLINQAK